MANEPAQRYAVKVDKDVQIPMRDGARLVANVYRPDAPGRFPALTACGPYGKDVHLKVNFPAAYAYLAQHQSSILANSSGKYLQHEMPDLECFVREGYAVVRGDIRGCGKTPGLQDPNSPQEYRDGYDVVEWAARQPWCSGRVGMAGISYHAVGQWMVAAQRPPHLACILPWHGSAEYYEGRTRQGGIFCDGFTRGWWERQRQNQHGSPSCPYPDFITGERNTGPASLSAAQLDANRANYVQTILAHPLLDAWYRERMPRYEDIEIPALVVANWGGLGLHLRGTIEGWMKLASKDKWLKVESGPYFTTPMLPESIALQLRFFDRYLKGIDNGWEREARVEVSIRGADDTVERWIRDSQWPLGGTRWTRMHLDLAAKTLAGEPGAAGMASFEASGAGLSFRTPPLARELTFAGPSALRLWVSSTTPDADLFVTLRAYDPQGREVVFHTSTEPRSPVSQGWLRVSHRKTDPRRSTEWLPVHTHDEEQMLEPGEVVQVDIPIWPASLRLPIGSRLELLVAGRDFERPEEPGAPKGATRGSGLYLHRDPADRPPARFAGAYTLHAGPGREPHLLLPVIPV
ncbi:MAG: CocE/NonD family hydrolase [Burkholderiales bacterium]|nr:CocE/NonD family hydrolase [Burkholderiales bacterium]